MNDLVPVQFGLDEGERNPLVLRAKIEELEAIMFASPARLEIPHRDYFAQGLYAREILIKKGTVLTGKIHKFEHLNFVSYGDISVLTEGGVKRIVGPATLVSPPGTKRVGYAHEDTLWTTVHACSPEVSFAKDGDRAEADLVVCSYDEYEQFLNSVKLKWEDKKCLT